MPILRVVSGAHKGKAFPLRGGEVLGRDPANEIPLEAPAISRRHCRFVVEDGQVLVLDLDSSNGTFVNEEKVARKKLELGDAIRVGSVSFVLERDEKAEASRVASPPRATTRPRSPSARLAQSSVVITDDVKGAKEEAFSLDATSALSLSSANDARPERERIRGLEKRLAVVFEVSQALVAVSDEQELLGGIMDKLFSVFPQAERGFILLGKSWEALEPAIVRHRASAATKEIAISRTIARRVYEEKRAILSANAAEEFQGAASLTSLQIHTLIVAPIVSRDVVHGFIQLDSADSLRRFGPDDLNLLLGVASSAAIFLENLKLVEAAAREAKEREAIRSELRVAHRIQLGLLPKQDPSLPGFEVSGRMRTAKEVGGDYYDFIPAEKDLLVVIGDVSGKGVPAGLVMVEARSVLRSIASLGRIDPRAAAVELNRILRPDLKPGMFMSLLLVRAGAARTLELAGCGHERPFVYRARTRSVEKLELGGLVIGVVADNAKQVAQASVALDPGDQLLLYTDGVPEAVDAAGKQYGLERLERAIAQAGSGAPSQLLDALEKDLARHVGEAPQHDDVTIIAIRRK